MLHGLNAVCLHQTTNSNSFNFIYFNHNKLNIKLILIGFNRLKNLLEDCYRFVFSPAQYKFWFEIVLSFSFDANFDVTEIEN